MGTGKGLGVWHTFVGPGQLIARTGERIGKREAEIANGTVRAVTGSAGARCAKSSNHALVEGLFDSLIVDGVVTDVWNGAYWKRFRGTDSARAHNTHVRL
jgi:hypothetical protein